MDEEKKYKKRELTRINNLSNEALFGEVFHMVNGMNFDGDYPDYVVSAPYPYWLFEELKKELKIRLNI